MGRLASLLAGVVLRVRCSALFCFSVLACVHTNAGADTQPPTYWYVGPPAIDNFFFTPNSHPTPGPAGQLFRTAADACNGDEARDYRAALLTGIHSVSWPYAGDCWVTCLSAEGCQYTNNPFARLAYNIWGVVGGFAAAPQSCPAGWPATAPCVRACQPGYELVNGNCVQPGGGPNVDAEARNTCTAGNPATAGNPIAINTGDKRLTEVDHSPANGSHLEFVRYYNAIPIRARTNFSPRWMHTYSGWIDELQTPPWAYVFRPNGGMRWLGNLNAPIVNGRQRWTMTWGYNEQVFKLFDTANKPTGWLLIDTDGSVETYDSGGRLKTITKPDGTVLTMWYSDGNRATGVYVDAAGNPTTKALPVGVLTQVTDSRGRWLKFSYTEPLRFKKLLTSEGLEYRYTTDAVGNPTSVTYPDGSQRQYVYNESSLTGGVSLPYALTGLIDAGAARLASYSYDSVGRATQTQRWADAAQTRPAGPYGLAHATNSTTVTNGVGASHTYTYALVNGRRVLTSVSQPGGSGCGPASSAITYDANANVASRTDFNGFKTCYAYDLTRNLETKRVEGLAANADCNTAMTSPPAGARVISTQWHPDWRLETRVAEPKKITTITYNGQGATCAPSTVLVDGKPTAVVCARSEQATTDESGALGFGATVSGTARTSSYTYTTYARVLTAIDPNGKVTTATYYADDDSDLGRRGSLATVTNAAGHLTRYTAYNVHGQVTQMVDPNGLTTDLTYDARQRLASRKVGNELTGFSFDTRGLLTNVTLPDGASVTYTYDTAHRLTGIQDHKGNRVVYTLDAMGNRINEQLTDPGGTLVRNIQRSIDALNRVQQLTGSLQ